MKSLETIWKAKRAIAKGASSSAGMEGNWRKRNIAAIDKTLRAVLGRGRDQLVRTMRYAVFSGGKRLRPLLCLAAADAFNITPAERKKLLLHAGALELVHTYSLIHDDLPCMDNDELRRGKPTCHIKYGEANALLAGDALLTLAFEILAASGDSQACKVLAQSAGVDGMIGGQRLDIANEANSQATLRAMHEKKTGRLFAAALALGGLGAKISPGKQKALARLGLELGLLYQIKDDIADSNGSGAASRDQSKKRTYASVLGLSNAQGQLSRQQREVAERISKLGADGTQLDMLCTYVCARPS